MLLDAHLGLQAAMQITSTQCLVAITIPTGVVYTE